MSDPVVVFLCVSGSEALLARRRADDSERGLAYVYGGAGHVEPGEAPEAAAKREIREEYGLTVTELVPLGVRGIAYDFLAIVPDVRKARNIATNENSELLFADATHPETWARPWHPLFAEFVNAYMTVNVHARFLSLRGPKPIRPLPVMR